MTNQINQKIAELIGAHCGDGTLYRTSRGLVWELRGELAEKGYYIDNICPILKDLFGFEILSKFRSGGANGVWGVQTSNRLITGFFVKWGFTPGAKTHTVKVPDYIFSSSVEIKRSFARGLFDTDGCLRFERINKQIKHTYPRIELGFASIDLRDTLKLLLDELGFRSFIWTDNVYYKLCISGKRMLEKWMREIKPSNPKHLKKYYFWKEHGFYSRNAFNATVA